MDITLGSLVGTLVITVLGAFIGAFASSYFTGKRDHQVFRKERRVAAAGEMLDSLGVLLRMLRDSSQYRDAVDWVKPIDAYYEAAEDAWHIIPAGLRHAKRSVRAALGETLGVVAVVDLRPDLNRGEQVSARDKWRDYAAEYVSGLMVRLREWRDSGKSTVAMPTFDEWLRANGLYPESLPSVEDASGPRI